MREISYTIIKEFDGYSVDRYLCKVHGFSRRLITKLKRTENGISLNGNHARSVDILKENDSLTVILEDSKKLEPNGELNVEVVFEDDDIIVFNKPVGMPVHPSFRHQGDTLGNYFAYLHGECSFRPINRLDRDTSGLCVCAKNAHAANLVGASLDKTYFAVVCGNLVENGSVDAPIGRLGESIIVRCVRPDGQEAKTDYTIIKGNEKYTFVRVKLHNGRTHQIRVHFSHIGYPLAGDDMYGGSTADTSVQALHCGEVTFTHPISREVVKLCSDIREDMRELID